MRILDGFAGACVAVLPGNHDYYAGAEYFMADFWPDTGANSFACETRPYPLHDFGLDVVLYPAPCDHRHSATNRLGWLRELSEKPAARWH